MELVDNNFEDSIAVLLILLDDLFDEVVPGLPLDST